MSPEASESIVRDLTLDPHSLRPDIQVRWLVPIEKTDYLLLSPHLVYTSNWEVCLLRNWANQSQARYGEVVASTKARLADSLAALFKQPNLKASSIKKGLVDSKGKTVGDVDVAIFDKLAGYLVLAQVKWLIEPDSFQDESHAREEMGKGIVQLSNVADSFTNNKDWVIAQVFPNAEVASDDIKEVDYFLISHGNVTSVIEAPSPRISMLDYQLSFDILKDSENLPLKERFGRVLRLHDEIRQISAKNVGYKMLATIGSR